RKKGARAIARVRAGEGPGLIHATVTRPYSHSAADSQAKYRPQEELVDEAEHDPILLLERELVKAGILTQEEAQEIRTDAKDVVSRAAREALAAPRPDPATMLDHVYVVPDIPGDGRSVPSGGNEKLVGFGDAIR